MILVVSIWSLRYNEFMTILRGSFYDKVRYEKKDISNFLNQNNSNQSEDAALNVEGLLASEKNNIKNAQRSHKHNLGNKVMPYSEDNLQENQAPADMKNSQPDKRSNDPDSGDQPKRQTQ